jgi:hypothetical protein
MYQHCIPLKYVNYGKIEPYKDKSNWMLPAYTWLGFHCGYCPQVWLARGNSAITGFRSKSYLKKRKMVIRNRREAKATVDSVLFEFDILPQKMVFPVDYDVWCWILGSLLNLDSDSSKKDFDDQIRKGMDSYLKTEIDYKKEKGDEYVSDDPDYILEWEKFDGDVDAYVQKYLFVEKDQVVVPALNLKTAKRIICRNEKQKKKLRKLGFIEDRIKIKNVTRWSF